MSDTITYTVAAASGRVFGTGLSAELAEQVRAEAARQGWSYVKALAECHKASADCRRPGCVHTA